MDMDFRWGTRQPQIPASPVITEEVFNGNANAAAQAALAGAQAGAGFGQGQAYGNMLDAQKAKAKEAQDRAAVEKVLRDQADMQRWLKLEQKYAKITGDPRMKMAAMLAMAGQPGALQQALSTGMSDGGNAQKELDALESSIANDMFMLAGADKDTYTKLTAALLPLYKSKFDELVGKGAKSRMGSDWESGWGKHFELQESERKGRKGKAAAKKKSEEGLL